MIDFKKMDEKDFVFINRQSTTEGDKAFSEFLKTRKKKTKSRLKDKRKQKVS